MHEAVDAEGDTGEDEEEDDDDNGDHVVLFYHFGGGSGGRKILEGRGGGPVRGAEGGFAVSRVGELGDSSSLRVKLGSLLRVSRLCACS